VFVGLFERERIFGVAEEERVVRAHRVHHLADDDARLGRAVELLRQAVIAVQREAGHRVIQVRVRRHRQHVARHLHRPLFDGRAVFVRLLSARGEEAEVLLAHAGRQHLDERVIGGHLPRAGLFVEGALSVQHPRHCVVARFDLDVALRDLL
jgi:hypothetical protein